MDAPIVQKAHKFQLKFIALALTASIRICAFFGGLQSGKSVSGADALRDSLYGDNPLKLPPQAKGQVPEVWILSKSYVLAQAALNTFRWRAGHCFFSDSECRQLGLKREDSQSWWLKPSPNGDNVPIRLRVRTAHDPEALRATPVLLGAWCDEMAHWPEMAWLNLQGRGIVTRTKYIVTTTPKGKGWLYRDVALPGGWDPDAPGYVNPEKVRDHSIALVGCNSTDNPWADKAYLKVLERKFGPTYSAQELRAQFTANLGYVYDFDRLKDMADLPSLDPEYYPVRVVGLDPGYGDPYAALVALKDKEKRWWIADEMYLPSKAIVDDALPKLEIWMKEWKIQRIYCDKRRPSDWEALRRKKLPALPNIDVFGEDDRRTIMPMVRMIQRLFREKRIKIALHCEWFAEEAENYVFPERDDRNAGENPVDYRNHLMDAIRYAICSVDALPEDRRPRYRGPPDMAPQPRDKKIQPTKIASAKEYLMAQEKKFNDRERKDYGRRGLTRLK